MPYLLRLDRPKPKTEIKEEELSEIKAIVWMSGGGEDSTGYPHSLLQGLSQHLGSRGTDPCILPSAGNITLKHAGKIIAATSSPSMLGCSGMIDLKMVHHHCTSQCLNSTVWRKEMYRQVFVKLFPFSFQFDSIVCITVGIKDDCNPLNQYTEGWWGEVISLPSLT